VVDRADDETPPGGVSNARWCRPISQFAADGAAWALAILLASVLRFDFHLEQVWWRGMALTIPWALVGQAALGSQLGLYRRRWRYGSFDELLRLAATVLAVGLLLTGVVMFWSGALAPRSIPFLATPMALSAMAGGRSLRRAYRSHRNRPLRGTPIVIVGAGDAACQMVENLLAFPNGPYRPVALVDDNPFKSDLRVQSVRVEGSIDDLPAIVYRRQAEAVLLAIPTGGSELVRRVKELADDSGLPLLVLPSVTDMFGAPASSDIRPVAPSDLLGRDAADIDPDLVAHYITDRRVLVTGAGGSIGSELCRQLARFEPSQLVMLDRDESGLHAAQLSIEGRALLDSPNLVLADIRDEQLVDQVFQTFRPHVVFHAAALKHLTLLERAPAEAWKTNVDGTEHVLAAAVRAGVERVVNISTDKAAAPISVLGCSKRITERLTAHRASTADGTFVSVRFGNVLGSRGSVLTVFRAQADAGGPITVTHPDVTRYFMTVEEAVRLTIFAGAIGTSGEVLVLDMGNPVRITAVAERFARQHTPALEIVYTGLRPGEKLHEDLLAIEEADERPVHPLITHVPVAPLSAARIAELSGGERSADALRLCANDGSPVTARASVA